jgi:hypothetical protein
MSPIASTRPRFATPDWGASAETPLCFFEAPLNLSYARFSRPITTTRTVPGDLWLHENKFDGSRAYWLHKTLAFGPEQDRLCRIDDPLRRRGDGSVGLRQAHDRIDARTSLASAPTFAPGQCSLIMRLEFQRPAVTPPGNGSEALVCRTCQETSSAPRALIERSPLAVAFSCWRVPEAPPPGRTSGGVLVSLD